MPALKLSTACPVPGCGQERAKKPGAKSRRWGCITCYGISDVRPDDLPAFAVANGIRKLTRALLASPEPRTTQAPEQLVERMQVLKRERDAARDISKESKKRIKRTETECHRVATELGLAEAKVMEEQKAAEAAERVVRQLTFDFKLVQEQIPVLQASNATLQKRMARQLAHAESLQNEIGPHRPQHDSRSFRDVFVI